MQDVLSSIHPLSIHLSNDQRQGKPTLHRSLPKDRFLPYCIVWIVYQRQHQGAAGVKKMLRRIRIHCQHLTWFSNGFRCCFQQRKLARTKKPETWYRKEVRTWPCKCSGWIRCSFIDPISGNLLPRFWCKRMSLKGSGLGKLQSTHQQMQSLFLDE